MFGATETAQNMIYVTKIIQQPASKIIQQPASPQTQSYLSLRKFFCRERTFLRCFFVALGPSAPGVDSAETGAMLAGAIMPVDGRGGLNPVGGGGLMVLSAVGAASLTFFCGAAASALAANFTAVGLLTAALRLSSSPSSSAATAVGAGSCSCVRRL